MKVKTKHSHGKYIMLIFDSGDRILEHRYLISKKIRRNLKPNEVVHHKDNDGKNNKIENLQVMTIKEHAKFHGIERRITPIEKICPQCHEIFKIRLSKYKYMKNKGNKNFCSRKCSGKFNSDKYWKESRVF